MPERRLTSTLGTWGGKQVNKKHKLPTDVTKNSEDQNDLENPSDYKTGIILIIKINSTNVQNCKELERNPTIRKNMKDLLALGAQGRKKKRTEETQHCFSSRHNDLFLFKTTRKCFSVKIDSYFTK